MFCSSRCNDNQNVTRNYCKLQQDTQITICICDHQARDLLACVDTAMILNNCKIVAQDTPVNLVSNESAKIAYFGESFKIN